MPVDRQLLHDAETALRNGEPLDDEAREYVARILRTVNQLAFYGDDLEIIFEHRMKSGVVRLEENERFSVNGKMRMAVNDMNLLALAHKKGKGLKQAEALIQAKREGKHVVACMVEFDMVIEGVTKYAARWGVAKATGLKFDSVRKSHQDWQKDQAKKPKP